MNGTSSFVRVDDATHALSPNQVTLAGWVRPGNSTNSFILASGAIQLRTTLANQFLVILTNQASQDSIPVYFGSFTPNTWTHVAISWDGTAIKTYQDGVLKTQNNFAGTGLLKSNYPFYIGANAYGAPSFAGTLDDFRMYILARDLDGVRALINDSDNDGILDADDNCPNILNTNQLDSDNDGFGNLCDNAPNVNNPGQEDEDLDGIGSIIDNCPNVSNLNQQDLDGDSVGNSCDNCISVSNSNQLDIDGDGVGNACAVDSDSDGIADQLDECPSNPNLSKSRPGCGCDCTDACLDRKITSTTNDLDIDGVSNNQEVLDGTNAADPGSYKMHWRNPGVAIWNSFLSQTNILETLNNDQNQIAQVRQQLFLRDGTKLNNSRVDLSLSPMNQQDVIISDFAAFKGNLDSYGTVQINSNGQALSGRMSLYKVKNGLDFDLAYAVPIMQPTYGTSFVSFNTNNPTTNIGELNNLVANWLSVINLHCEPKNFNLIYYDIAGNVLRIIPAILKGGERIDFDGGHGFLKEV